MNDAGGRRSARANVIMSATIEDGVLSYPVRVGNLSAHGAMVIGEQLPPREAVVTLRCNGVAVAGMIVWTRSGRAGIEFAQVIDLSEVARKAPPPPAAIETVKDTREVTYKRPGFRGNQMSEEERRIVEDYLRPKPEGEEEA